MDKIAKQAASWEYLQQLPAEYAGFTHSLQQVALDSQYIFFSYENAGKHRKVTALYDKMTKDYMVLITIGLSEYFDISFIATSLTGFEASLAQRLLPALDRLDNPVDKDYDGIFRKKEILTWPYATELPQTLAGFELFVDPRQPVKIINGSYIIIDYSDFKSDSNLIIYYNIYRDEFFGEIRLRRTPRMVSEFDAKELALLTDKLKTSLFPSLSALRTEIDKSL